MAKYFACRADAFLMGLRRAAMWGNCRTDGGAKGVPGVRQAGCHVGNLSGGRGADGFPAGCYVCKPAGGCGAKIAPRIVREANVSTY